MRLTLYQPGGGLRAHRACGTYAIEAHSEHYCWYSLDLSPTGLGGMQQPLLKMAEEKVRGKSYEVQHHLHCTMYFKQSIGADVDYERK